MFKLPKSLIALATLALSVGTPAMASTLSAVDLTNPAVVRQDNGVGKPEQSTLFTTQTRRNQNVQNSGQLGSDIDLLGASGTSLASKNFLWGASGTSYNWSLAFNGTNATLKVGSNTITTAVGSGTWNVVSFFLRADDTSRFTTSTVTLSTLVANGELLTVPLVFSTTNSTLSSLNFALDGFSAITSLAGTMKFDFVRKTGATGSPADALSWGVKAQQVAPVPLPAAMPMSLVALGLLGWAARRRRSGAAPA
jgi:hypothetical protein